MGTKLELAIGVLNGAVGDYLARTGNGLATGMALVQGGAPLPLTREGLARAYPEAGPRAVLLVHGLMNTEAAWRQPDGSDYGALLHRDLGLTPLYLRYNSGRTLAESGAALSALLEGLLGAWPVALEELLPVGYSMGGLVIRAACHAAAEAGHTWPARVRKAVYVGTPHRGAPAERVGRLVARALRAVPDPYARLVGELADLRSAGIKDMGDAHLTQARHPVPLLPGIRHHLVAGALSAEPWLAALFGDAVVPLASATDVPRPFAPHPALPPERVRVLPGLSHLALPRHPEVYAQLRAWCEAP